MFLVGRNRLEDPRRHHRRQGEGHKSRDDHRAGHRHRELGKEPAGRTFLKGQRQKDGHQRNRDGDDRKADFRHRLVGRFHRRHAFLDMAENIFQDHDGVIHHHADGQHERQHRQDIDRIAEQTQDGERPHDGNRNGDGGNNRGAKIAQEQIDDDHDEQEGNAERHPDFVDRVLDVNGFVVVENHFDPGGQRRPDSFHLRLDAVGHLDGVGLRLLDDAEKHARPAVVAGDRALVFDAAARHADVPQTDDLGAVIEQHQPVELLRGF